MTENAISLSRRITRHANNLLMLSVFTALALYMTVAQAQDGGVTGLVPEKTFEVAGSELPWSMKIPNRWIGGNINQLEAMLSGNRLGGSTDAVRTLRDALRGNNIEAGAIHLDDAIDFERGSLNRRTIFVAMRMSGDAGPSFRKDKRAAWNDFAQDFVALVAPPKARIKFQVPSHEETVGGLRAYQTIYVIEGTRENDSCVGATVVPLGRRGTHVLMFWAAIDRCEWRYAEFKTMLQGLRYDPRLVEEVSGMKR